MQNSENKKPDRYETVKTNLLEAITAESPTKIAEALKDYEALPKTETKRKEEVLILSVARTEQEKAIKNQRMNCFSMILSIEKRLVQFY